jgi:hypothetical protein
MKTICCGLCRTKKGGRRKNQVEVVGFIKSSKEATTSPRRPKFPLHYDEPEAVAIGKSLDERERRG